MLVAGTIISEVDLNVFSGFHSVRWSAWRKAALVLLFDAFVLFGSFFFIQNNI